MRKCLHRWIALAIPIVFSIVTISGCTGTKAPGKKIKVGLLFPMKGGLGGAGENRVIAAKVALEEINEAGGVLDSELELVLKDTESNPETAKMRAKELVDEGVKFIIGAFASSATIKAAEVTVPNNVILLSPSSTSPEITHLDDNDYVFRVCASDLFQGEIAADYIYMNLKKRNAGIMYIDNAYGKGLKDTFIKRFTELGGEIVGDAVATPDSFSYTNIENNDYTHYLKKLNGMNPEIVFIIGYIETGVAVRQKGEIGYDFEFFGSEGLGHAGFIPLGGDATEGIKGTAPYHMEDDYFNIFRERYVELHPENEEPSGYAPTGYDAVILAALAMEKAGTSENTEAIRDALRDVSKGGDKVYVGEYSIATEKIRKGVDIDFEGAAGPHDFDEKGDVKCPYEIWKIVGGEYTHLETISIEN